MAKTKKFSQNLNQIKNFKNIPNNENFTKVQEEKEETLGLNFEANEVIDQGGSQNDLSISVIQNKLNLAKYGRNSKFSILKQQDSLPVKIQEEKSELSRKNSSPIESQPSSRATKRKKKLNTVEEFCGQIPKRAASLKVEAPQDSIKSNIDKVKTNYSFFPEENEPKKNYSGSHLEKIPRKKFTSNQLIKYQLKTRNVNQDQSLNLDDSFSNIQDSDVDLNFHFSDGKILNYSEEQKPKKEKNQKNSNKKLDCDNIEAKKAKAYRVLLVKKLTVSNRM